MRYLFYLVFLSILLTGCGFLDQASSNQNTPSLQIPGRNNARFEARGWLTDNPNTSPFAGNRFASKQDALAFVDQLYETGAAEVLITGILEEDWRIQEQGGPYADVLIVRLPDDKDQRAKLFELTNKETEQEGFAPEQDMGQTEILLWWD